MSREPRYDDRADYPEDRDRDVVAPPPGAAQRQDPYAAEPRYGERREKRSNGVATASLICGLGGLILLFVLPPLGILLALIAVVLGIVGIVKARDPSTGGTGQAVAGLVTGGISLLLTALLIWGLTALFSNEDFQQQLQEQIEAIEQGTTG